ncbi:MAG TPA: gephyrin-like molybdotransferase Glp [Burkholderiales bacterium]|nr:gephyrin-like molybdotransferase Glp [Burkholderiales bacterium]
MNQGLLSVEEALDRLLAGARAVGEIETVPTMAATGRVLAQPQTSSLNVPPLDNTSMDGYAVRAADCASGAARLRVAQRIAAGAIGKPLEPGTAARIFTGAPIPPGADAVVPQEQCEAAGDDAIVKHAPKPGEWIRRAGEDIRAGSTILDAGTRLRAQEIGLAASVGLASLPVFRRVRAALFSTGNELAMPGEPLPEGAIYNSNRFTLTGLLQMLGCEVADLGIVPDSLEATRATLREAAAISDVIVTSGGVSVGEEDHVKPAVTAEGHLDLWRIAIKPGRPLAYGAVRRADGGEASFIGLPGNPVSSFVTFLLFVRPFVLRLQGIAETATRAYAARADFDWPKPDQRREFLRARFNRDGGLDLYPNQSSGVLTSTVWGDGLVDNPAKHAIKRGDAVRFLPFAELLY